MVRMDDQPGAYAPQSPDLSAFASTSSYESNNNGRNEVGSYNLPPPADAAFAPKAMRQDSFSLPQSSYYQPPPSLHPIGSYGYPSYDLAPQDLHIESPATSKQIKTDPEQDPWLQYPHQQQQQQAFNQSQFPPDPEQMPPTPISAHDAKRGRPPSSSTKKPSRSSGQAVSKMETPPAEPVGPAPGELEGIEVRTKFPVARIKRIVQADDEVGKVAQATPVAVGKALELFMIHLTLASAEAATGSASLGRKGAGSSGGSKRLTSAHVKAAILKHDEFDFLRPIAEKIPDGPAHKTGESSAAAKAKAESEEDFDDSFDDDPSYGSKSRKKGGRR